MKRTALLFLIESLFGSPPKRVDLSLVLALAGVALTFWLLLAVH
jgi:hypothetical protein